MPRNDRIRDRGFTLVEMTVTLLIVAIATFSVFRIFNSTNQTYKRGTESIDGQQNTRAALGWLSRELRSAKGFTLIAGNQLTFQSDRNVPNQIRTFRLDTADQDGDGDTSELLLIRNPNDDGTPGVFTDEIAVGIDSMRFVYRDAAGDVTTSRPAVADVEVFIFATGNSMREEERDEAHGIREVAMSTRVRCRNLGKSVPTLGDVTPPSAPTGLAALMGCGVATLTWNANPEDDIAGFFLFYNKGSGGSPYTGVDAAQGPSPIFVGDVTGYTLTGLDMSANYYFNLQVVDAADNGSPYGAEANGQPVDSSPPPTPQNLTGRVISDDEIQLSWTPAGDWDVAWYKIVWYDDVNFGVTNRDSTTETSMTLGGLERNAVHTFSISATDNCGNESPLSADITVTMIPCEEDFVFPEIPAFFNATPGDEFVQLTWDPVIDTDVVGYQVYFQKSGGTGTTLLVGNVDRYSIYGLENGDTYQFQVAALDGCGHLGGYTAMLSAIPYHCADNAEPPTTPANMTAKDTGVGDQVDLSWARGFEQDVLGYTVYWGVDPSNLSSEQDVGDHIFFSLNGLTAGTTYYFAVSAYDVCGNFSLLTSPVSATPTWGCICPPTASITTPVDYEIVQGEVTWHVSAAACSGAVLEHVEFQIDGSTRYVDYSSPYQFGDLGSGWSTVFEQNGPYLLVAIATDPNGCETADTINVYVDNTGLGIGCLALVEGEDAKITGPFEEIVAVRIENQSDVDTYDTKAVVMEWDDPTLGLDSIAFDESPMWTAAGSPAASGDTLWLSWTYPVFPADEFLLEASFWDLNANVPPLIDLPSTAVDLTFLGSPLSPCGPYPLTIQAAPCFPEVVIYSVNSPNAYDVWGQPNLGDKYYTDRTYVLTYLPPQLENAVLVRTPNNDKNLGDSHNLRLEFTENIVAWIAYDPRGTPPDWITSGYEDTGLTIGVTDSGTSSLKLWKRGRNAGIRNFRGNKGVGWGGGVGTNYIVFITCDQGAS